MSCILYYSNYCQHSKQLLQKVSKNVDENIHFICIDNRVAENGKTFIVLQNGQKIILPENITRVPSLLLLNEGFKVINDSDNILKHLEPKQKQNMKEATMNNMEPMAFSFGQGSAIVSDNYSF